jgi:tryptophanyl-tRNA synthetase
MHQAFSKPDQIAQVDHQCRTAGFGCIDCKKILFDNMVEEIAPIQHRVKEMNENPGYIIEVLKSGAARCESIARNVMDEVRTKIGVKSEWLSCSREGV